LSVVVGFYRVCVIDQILLHSPADYVRRPTLPAESRGMPIRAAASGTVLTVQCNVVPETHGCDRDGSPQIRGCGWYVDPEHAAGVITRYCHMQTQPLVHVGQPVIVGQPLGLVGSSGHSSGPHLHYETHMGGDRTPAGAVDPVRFMRDVGAPLG
jgi:murein DD-endopeptidase MepM/ murein hydrolase activator NlpD